MDWVGSTAILGVQFVNVRLTIGDVHASRAGTVFGELTRLTQTLQPAEALLLLDRCFLPRLSLGLLGNLQRLLIAGPDLRPDFSQRCAVGCERLHQMQMQSVTSFCTQWSRILHLLTRPRQIQFARVRHEQDGLLALSPLPRARAMRC